MARIVLAEDEASVRFALKTIISMSGHDVLCASNGARAYTLLEDNPDIDLLITDVIMPELDGRELINRVIGKKDVFSFPIIMISGFVPFRDIVHLMESGVTKFLPKPVESDELIETINECLQSS